MTKVIGTVNDPGRVTAQIMAAVRAPNGISFKGEYDNKNTYNKYDWVTVNKNLAVYECTVTETTGDHPAILTEWKVVIQFPYGSSSSKGGEKVLGIDPVTGEFVVSNTFMEYLITNKGIWNAIDTYAKGDFVSVPANLGWYISKVDANNNVSPIGGNDNWQVVTEIPGGGIVSSDVTDYNGEDVPNCIFIEDYISAFSSLFQSAYLPKALILAPADAWTPRQTNGATWQIDETTTNKQCKGTLVFSPSTEQAIQLEIKNLYGKLITSANFKVKIHSKISGTIDETGDGVVWGVRGAIITDALDVNWNTDGDYNTTLTQTMTSGSAIYHSAFCTAIKAAASDQLAANSSLLIEIYRKVSDAGDDMNASAAILDVEILINQ